MYVLSVIYTKLHQAFKGVLNCCKLENAFKFKTNSFRCRDLIPKYFVSVVVYKLYCGHSNDSYHDESITHT